MMTRTLTGSEAALAATAFQSATQTQTPPVIEVVTAKLGSGVTAAQMEALDHEIGTNFIAKRPGFLSRESAPGSDHDWLVVVRWRSIADADASIESFSSKPLAEKFMALIEPSSLVMKRYSRHAPPDVASSEGA